jgi:sensor histidine kinase YesM
MKMSYPKIAIVAALAIAIFLFFLWVFGIIVSDVKVEFALGMTIVLVAGALTGRYIFNVRYKTMIQNENRVFNILIVLIIASFIVFIVVFSKLAEGPKLAPFSLTVFDLFLLSAFIGAFISLLRNRAKNKLVLAQTEQAQSKSELELLKSQLSPHFLFNTLNNLYGLSISEHQKVPSLLLKLSDLLRYSIYETKEMFVPLSDELEYLKNYIDFEKIRLGKRLLLEVDLIEVTDKNPKIAPMLLIVFVENAFKHSKNSQHEKIYINLNLELSENSILFHIKNSFNKSNLNSELKKKQSGFGLENVRKRLNLLYPEAHDLEIKELDNNFSINLKLNMK